MPKGFLKLVSSNLIGYINTISRSWITLGYTFTAFGMNSIKPTTFAWLTPVELQEHRVFFSFYYMTMMSSFKG